MDYYKGSHRDIYSRRKVFDFHHEPCVVEYLNLEDSVDDRGVSCKRLVYSQDDNSSRYKGLTSSDFELSNLLNAGVNLKFCQCRATQFDTLEKFNNGVVGLFNFLSKVENVNIEN